MKKASRTISGVTPIAVMTKPIGCPGECIYCPTYKDTPQSYTPESPAVLRGINCSYDSVKQVELRIRILKDMGHPVNKVEMIIMGGTFLSNTSEYQYSFIKGCYDALNGVPSETLEQAQKINETAERRCIGLCIETRPDWCAEEDIKRMISFGATRVEVGVQALDDEIYRIVKRGHDVSAVAKCTQMLKEAGLKVYYHWMPGLPGSGVEKDYKMSEMLFNDERFKPDGLKLYPTMVVENTILYEWYKGGKYTPYTKEEMISLVLEIKKIVPKYVRLSRVLRDIPAKFIKAGLKDSLRDVVRQMMEQQSLSCQCIRCREYGHRVKRGVEIGTPCLKRLNYKASGGDEVFLSFEDSNNTLFGLLRLRVQDKGLFGKGAEKTALVRELHVFGPEISLGEKDDDAPQHKGYGKQLMLEAERIAFEEYGAEAVAVLSGVGAREYYSKEFRYSLANGYMVKKRS